MPTLASAIVAPPAYRGLRLPEIYNGLYNMYSVCGNNKSEILTQNVPEKSESSYFVQGPLSMQTSSRNIEGGRREVCFIKTTHKHMYNI